jgi:serine/threonine-protein kinase
MAVLGSILFNRTLKQFLKCNDLESDKGVGLRNKISQSAAESIEKLIETIAMVDQPHSGVLKEICIEYARDSNQEKLLECLESDATQIRSAAADILSGSDRVHPSVLFKRLQETDVSKTEIIDILEAQIKNLRPEQFINNAVKLDKSYAKRLIELAAGSEIEFDFEGFHLDPVLIESQSIKIMLMRYFAGLSDPEAATVIGKFLTDKNRTIVIEALKSLRSMKVGFDASLVLPYIESMNGVEREMAIEIVCKQANAELIPKLAAWTTGTSDELREIFINLAVEHATEKSLEKFLLRLNQQEWWGKDQSVKCLLRAGDGKLANIARPLINHSDEFVRGIAEQLAAYQYDAADIASVGETALHENWQVRGKAIEVLGRSGKREALGMLKKVLAQWPDSATSVLNALAELGFSKGLEIAFDCLKMPEAAVQREALKTIARLTTEKHAAKVRGHIVNRLPKVQTVVLDTVEEVVDHLTGEFKLKGLDSSIKEYFQRNMQGSELTVELDQQATQKLSQPALQNAVRNIEELKKDDVWMERFRIVREVGRGAMGRVMLAEDEMVGEQLILKFMHPELTADSASRERFLREVKYSRKVSHPNVIRIHDMLFKDNLCAISMEFFVSRGVDELLKEKRVFQPAEGLDVIYQVAEGMSAAHKQEVIHRDLKPSNVLISEAGLVKVVDFGIASASSNSDSTLTKTGSIIGTPAYLSPERAKGLDANYRCDIYALGIIAYCMFVGSLPYRGEPMAILFQHLEGNAVAPHVANTSVPARLSQFIQKMMAVDAENRIQTMDDVCVEISKVRKKLKI